MWIWTRYTYEGYVRRLRAGHLTDPWVVHLGALYMFFSGNEEEALSTVRVALSFDTTPLLVRTLAFLQGIYMGIEGVYDVYRRYFRKIFSEGLDVEAYQWELLFAGDLAFYLGNEDRGWFYYKKYPKPHSEYMLRRKARIFFRSSPKDSRMLYESLIKEKKRLSLGDILRYAYLMGPRDGRKFLNEQVKNEEIGDIVADIADRDFDSILKYLDGIESAPVFEGVITDKKYTSQYIAMSVEVLSFLLGSIYMPWNNLFLRRHGFIREKIKLSPALWDYGYAYEYHFAYLPPWWQIGVKYYENKWNVNILLLSRRHGTKRRCVWGSKVMCTKAIEIYDRKKKPIVEVS